uniref:Cyclic AMP-responsive element-binding protein 3-like protein 1 n=1 Tax=Sinocyclocheilus rhinocerous TaxID=307959 RepID=A0A673L837_9TELE
MDTILDNFASDKLFPNSNLLDLEDLNESDFLSNVVRQTSHFSEQMEDFSNDLFNSFFDDHLLAERNPLLDMDLDPPNPDIQAEHSYSLSGDSAPQSPSMPIKSDDDTGYSKGLRSNSVPAIKAEPREVNQFLSVPSDEHLRLPPTPPSSHGSDSDGSQSPHSLPHSLPPSSPARLQARTSTAISSSPLLTAPHKLQGTSGPLMLTEEEKRTLIAEGYPVPNKLPLTKTEEKALKRVRRKIKNKISAQESRRKKKEYVECLEKRVENYTSENNELWKKVETLENANRSLLQQLQRLQALVSGKVPRSCKIASTQTGTCLMVVALCFVLVLGSLAPCLPELSLYSSSLSSSSSHTVKSAPLASGDLYTTSQVRSRSLLFYDEGAPVEDGHGRVLSVERMEGVPRHVQDLKDSHEQDHSALVSRYLSQAQPEPASYSNTSAAPLRPPEPHYHSR